MIDVPPGFARALVGAIAGAGLAAGASFGFWGGWEAALWRRSDALRAEGRAACQAEAAARGVLLKTRNLEAARDAGIQADRDLGDLDDGAWRERLRRLCDEAPGDCGRLRLLMDETPEPQP